METNLPCHIKEPHSHLVHGVTFDCENGQKDVPEKILYTNSTTLSEPTITEKLKEIEILAKELQEMINEPATKEWFEKHNK